jgi:hypothetical protein
MMKYPLGTLQHKLELQPDRDANTLVAMGQWANRLIVGTDTGSTRRIHFYEPRQDMRQFINDVGVDTQLDGEFNALAMSHDGHRIACGDMYNNLPSGAVYLFNVVAGDTQYGQPTNYALTPLGTLTLNPVVADAYFGAACCFYNATGGVFVGAPGVANDRGSVFLFEQVGGVWTNTQEIPGPAGADGFGTAVSSLQQRQFAGGRRRLGRQLLGPGLHLRTGRRRYLPTARYPGTRQRWRAVWPRHRHQPRRPHALRRHPHL